MRRDKTKSVLSIIATFISVILILIYWFAPAQEASHPLYKLFFDCIPDSLVVLITIPIVYWLLYTRGLTNMGDCPLFTGQSTAEHEECRSHHCGQSITTTPRQEGKEAGDNDNTGIQQDILFVVGLQKDFARNLDTEKMRDSINTTLRLAESRATPVIFTKCHLPSRRCSDEQNDPPHANGVTNKTHNAELSNDLYKPAGSVVIDFCVQSENHEIPPGKNAVLDMLISNPAVYSVYVTGIAPEYCIRAICQNSLQHGKKTVALGNTIAMTDDGIEQSENVWRDLTAEGLVRQERLS